MQTVEQLQEAAAQAKSVADMIAQERKAVEERQEAQRRALEEQKKLAAAETELIRLQLELAGTIPPAEAMGFDYAAGADGDKDTSSDSSSEDDEPEQFAVFQRGGGEKVTCHTFAASLLPPKNKKLQIPVKKVPTTRSSSKGRAGGTPEKGSEKGKVGGRHQPKRSSPGAGAGAGGSGGQPPKKPRGGRKTPDDAVNIIFVFDKCAANNTQSINAGCLSEEKATEDFVGKLPFLRRRAGLLEVCRKLS